VSIHAPLNEVTRGRFNRATFAKMKPGSILINTARGGLVVEADLVEALTSGHLAGAGLDVFEVEPVAPDNPLLKLDNVVMTPHRSSEETRAMVDMGVEAARCIVELYAGRWPEGCVVNNQFRDQWCWDPI
jgi:D-3-phosphoglycerate dehydrogenase